jgi:molybdopterin-guanine dinucleotide biosynthesis protein A
MTELCHVTAIVLAGGSSSRIGCHKAFLHLGDIPLIEMVTRKLETAFAEVIVCSNQKEQFASLGYRVVGDAFPCALGGLYSGLDAATEEWGFAVGCDMPFVDVDLVRSMAGYLRGTDVVVPQTSEGMEPLHAFYSKRCLEPIRKRLLAGERRLISFFDDVSTRRVVERDIEGLTQRAVSFFNINTREDYDRAVEMAATLEAAEACQRD